jgi:hypothetical protein
MTTAEHITNVMTLTAVVIALTTASTRADLVTNVTAIGSDADDPASRTPSAAVNGSGLNASATPNVPGSWEHQGGTTQYGGTYNWLDGTGGAGVSDAWIAFDLGAVLTLESMNVFNFGVSTGGENERGVNQGDIYYRSDGFGNNTDNNATAFDNTGWTLLGTAGAQTFTEGPTDGAWQGADNISLAGITARYFAIDINTTHGDPDQVGLGEVQFFTFVESPTTPGTLIYGK